MNTREMREESLKIANQARALLDTMDASNQAEKTVEFDRMMADSDGLATRAANAERAEARSNEFAKIATTVADKDEEVRGGDHTAEQRLKAFDAYLRGDKALSELRALGVSTDSKGGAVAPASFVTSLITKLEDFGPMLDPTFINMLVTSTGNEIEMPTFEDDAEAIIIGENSQIPEDDLEFGTKKLGAFKYTSKLVRVSNELLQDAAVPVDVIVADALAKRIGRGVNRHLTTGTGSGQPEGVVTATTKAITSASSTAFAVAELVKLQHAISSGNRLKASWMFNDSTLLSARTMADADGKFIWQPGLTLDAPATILGRPYRINPYMDDTLAAGKVAAVYGDFKKYTVRRSLDIYVRRLNERFADYDQAAFVGLARFDGRLLDSDAFAKLVLKA